MKQFMMALLGLLVISLVAAGSAAAFGWGRNEAVQSAIENNDFGAWKEAIAGQLTEENFERAVERHNNRAKFRESQHAMDAEDYESYLEAVEGFPGNHPVMTEEEFNSRIMMRDAMESGDYEAYLGLVQTLGDDHPVMSEEEFTGMVEMHRLNGDAPEGFMKNGFVHPGPCGGFNGR